MKLGGLWNGRRGTGRVGRKGRKHIGEADREESQGDDHRRNGQKERWEAQNEQRHDRISEADRNRIIIRY